MRLLKTHSLLRFLNSYVVDSPQPANITYLWNFGSLLATQHRLVERLTSLKDRHSIVR